MEQEMSDKALHDAVQEALDDQENEDFDEIQIDKEPVSKRPNRAVFFAMAAIILVMLCLCSGSSNQTLQALYLGVALVVFVVWIVKGGRLLI